MQTKEQSRQVDGWEDFTPEQRVVLERRKRERDKMPWFELIMAGISFTVGIYCFYKLVHDALFK